jgi:hypothetical protein
LRTERSHVAEIFARGITARESFDNQCGIGIAHPARGCAGGFSIMRQGHMEPAIKGIVDTYVRLKNRRVCG